jgi:hypothetical protein
MDHSDFDRREQHGAPDDPSCRHAEHARRGPPYRTAAQPSTYGAFGTDAGDIVALETHDGGPRLRHPRARILTRLTKHDLLIAAALVAVALLVRWPFIEKGETLLHSDEAIVGLMAQDIAAGRQYPIYFYGQRYMGALEAYVIAAISPLFDDPIRALRFGPACFFAALAAVQYLMLTRWFGRRGGLFGAAVLLAAAPMFVQWSISARGGYIEILLWGSLLLWAYSEWFVPDSHQLSAVSRHLSTAADNPQSAIRNPQSPVRRFLFGALLGSGLWINPSIVLFIVPIVAHALLHRPLAALYSLRRLGAIVSRIVHALGRTALPVALLAAVLILNTIYAVWVDHGQVRSLLLLGLVPRPAALALLAVGAAAAAVLLVRSTDLLTRGRAVLQANGVMILGVLLGALPAVLYVVQAVIGLRTLDPSLPLGIRPIWLTGDPLNQLLHGLPVLFGADPRPFLQLVSVGRDTAIEPLGIVTSSLAVAANFIAFGGLLSTALIVLVSHRAHWGKVLRLTPALHPPVVLLGLGFAGTILLYVVGGCTLDFTTIRYLLPLWAFLPGLLAAAMLDRRLGRLARFAPACVVLAWAVGQFAMSRQLGGPHPLRGVATAVTARGCDFAVAEPLDAHLLSYLTRQQCRVAEFESFWPRLGHYRRTPGSSRPVGYIVQTQELDRPQDWIDGGWPGEPPPETKRFLWPRLRSALNADPTLLLAREPLPGGYELIRTRRPLPERLPPGDRQGLGG